MQRTALRGWHTNGRPNPLPATGSYTRESGGCLYRKAKGRVFVRSGGGCDNTADPADVCRRCETP
ncbi:hypothetical protein [Phocaeicola coprocola]|uniref:hypothetical protein n=1 Tax=Phocaeicola coprocola TaxID=310298 RepID=UPI001EF58FDD|nr:hypothetical protein [Phocaeicola coprocola]